MIWLVTLPLVVCAMVFTMATTAVWDVVAAAPNLEFFFLGALIGIVVAVAILRFFPLLFVLDHELTHFFAALVVLRKPVMIAAEARSGVVVIEGRGSTFVSLAPHSVPVLSLLSLILLLITDQTALPWVVGFIGITWGYHGTTDLYDALTGGSDLSKVGAIASRALILSGWLLLYPLVVIATHGGLQLVTLWGRTAWTLSKMMWSHGLSMLNAGF